MGILKNLFKQPGEDSAGIPGGIDASTQTHPSPILTGVLQHRRDLGSMRVVHADLGDSDMATTKFGDEISVAIISGERSGAIVLFKLSWWVQLAQELGRRADDISNAVICAAAIASLVKRAMPGDWDAVRCACIVASEVKRGMQDGWETEWRSFNFETVTDGNSMFDNLGPSWVVPCLTVFLWSSGHTKVATEGPHVGPAD